MASRARKARSSCSKRLRRSCACPLTTSLPATIQLSIRTSRDVWPVEVDPSELELALLNLAVNARDAMPEGGELRVVTATSNCEAEREMEAGDCVVVTVSDTGTGIPPQLLPKVFDPFFTTKAPGKGSGLGLSLVYQIVTAAGGEVQLRSEVGRGTTVELRLPVAREDGSADPDPAR